MSDIGVSEADVYEALSSLGISKATGIDSIGPKILLHCALALYKPLHHLFLLSLSLIPTFPLNRKHIRLFQCSSLIFVTISTMLYIKNPKKNCIQDILLCFCFNFGFQPKHSPTQQLLLFLYSIKTSLSS